MLYAKLESLFAKSRPAVTARRQPFENLGNMSSAISRSLKPASYLTRGKRPGGPRRADSGSSMSSMASALSSRSEDPFVFSPGPSTTNELQAAISSSIIDGASFSMAAQANTNGAYPPQISHTAPTTPPSPSSLQSRPIAIELPVTTHRRISAAPVYTPDAPLSGRGDLPGGYFPLHEDPDKRVHRPHPFHPDVRDARNLSLSRAAENSSPTSAPAMVSGVARSEPHKGQHSKLSNTPVTSYVSSGAHASPMPVGKYYPSNYENRYSKNHKKVQQQNSRTPAGTPGMPSSVKSDTQVPTSRRTDAAHVRNDSEIEQRLRQYQRDMVAQATQAARHIFGQNGGASTFATSVGMHGVSLQQFQANGHKPTSPRLAPLGSPGPVTPMDLEGTVGGGYMTRGRAVPNADAGAEGLQVEAAWREQAERQRREGSGSSTAIGADGYGF